MSVLERIFAERREDVSRSKIELPLEQLKARLGDCPPTRGFVESLRNRNRPVGLIAEIKPASPSKGDIKKDLDAALLAQHYAWAGAHALSVLTEPRHFGGSKENLIAARGACPLPVLRKDFIDDAYQVYESRTWGADAVLLIAAALKPDQLRALHDLAKQLDMDVLVEAHSEQEAELALSLGADLIGVNNRDLSTLETNMAVTETLIPMIKGKALAVSESAMETKGDVHRAEKAGADAVLIGTVFCQSSNPEEKVREVMGW